MKASPKGKRSTTGRYRQNIKRDRFITVAGRDMVLPLTLIMRLVNHALSIDVMEGTQQIRPSATCASPFNA